MDLPMHWKRRVAGMLWLAAWIVVLYAVAAPWRSLGGVVSERLRWMEWFVLLAGLSTGVTLGRLGRDMALGVEWRTHLRFLRFLLYPVAVLTAASLVLLALVGERGPAGVVFTAFLSYWAGMDLAYGAVPMIDGRPYSLTRGLPAEEEGRGEEQPRGGWVPPWERY